MCPCVRVCVHTGVAPPRVRGHVCEHVLWLCPDEACWLPSSCSAWCTDRACNHGKLPSPGLKLRLLPPLPQDLFTKRSTRKGLGRGLCRERAWASGEDKGGDWAERPQREEESLFSHL